MSSPNPSPTPSPIPFSTGASSSSSHSSPHSSIPSSPLPSAPPSQSSSSSSPPSSTTATRKKVMSFFSSLTSELHQQTALFTKPAASHSPQPSVASAPNPPPASLTAPSSTPDPAASADVQLILAPASPCPSLLFYHHVPIVASVVGLPVAPAASAVFDFHRHREGGSTVVQSSPSATYRPSMDDVESTISCTLHLPSPSLIPALTSASAGPIVLSATWLSSTLSSFAPSNALTVPFRDCASNDELLLTVRRTSIRITTAASSMRHTFRIPSSSPSSLIVEARDGRRLFIKDGVTERTWEGVAAGEEDRDRVVLLVRLLLEKPDFEEAEEVHRCEERERKEAADALVRRKEAERRRDERERERREKEAARLHEADAHSKEEAETKVPSASTSPTNPSTPILPAHTPTARPPPVIPASSGPVAQESKEAESAPSSALPALEVCILASGSYQRLLAASASLQALSVEHGRVREERDRLVEKVTTSLAQYKDDQMQFARQLELLMKEKQELLLQRDRDARAHRDDLSKREDELKEARVDVDAIKRQLAQLSEQLSAQSAELVKTRDELRGSKAKEADWAKERDATAQRHRAAVEDAGKAHLAALEAVREEMRKREEKSAGKWASTEAALKKEIELYRKELGKMKEKEARVDVLEMENHKLTRELEYTREQQRKAAEGGGKAATAEERDDERAARERAELVEAVRSKEERVRQLEVLVDNKQRELEELQEIGIDFAGKEMAMEEEQKRLKDDVDALSSQLATLTVQREEHRAAMDAKDAELKRALGRLDELESSNNYHKKKIVTLTQQIERSIKEKALIKQQHSDELHARGENLEEVKELKRENAMLRQDAERYKSAYNDLILGRPTAPAMSPASPSAALGVPGVAAGLEASPLSPSQLSQIEGMKELVNSLTEQLTDKDEAFKHLRKTNQILGLRVKELEERFKDQLTAAPAAGGSAGAGRPATNGARR